MKRSLIVSALLALALLFLSSCDPEAELSYIDFQGVRYPVSGAVDDVWNNDEVLQWDVQIGTGDRDYATGEYWTGTDPLLIASLFIEQDYYDYDFKYIAGRSVGTLTSLDFEYYDNGEPMNLSPREDPQNLISVTETGGLFVVDINILLHDGTDGGAWLTGRFVGQMSEYIPPPTD